MEREEESFPRELQARFELLGTLGVGGMGAVWRVRDRELGREVALKTMLRVEDPTARSRFLREAQALAGIRHPGVVEILDFGHVEEGPYLVMELLEGYPLDRAPEGEPFLEFFLPLAGALEAVHRAGAVHRDLKPGNLFRTREGRTVLVDFGLVRGGEERTRLTEEGSLLGTLLYLAPEALRGGGAGPPADWWAYGASLYQLYERRPPYKFHELVPVTRGQSLPPLEFHRLSPDHAAGRVVEACLDPDPDRRPTSEEEIRSLAGEPQDSTPPGRSPVLSGSLASGPPRSSRALPPSPARERPRWVALVGLVVLGLLGFLSAGREARPPEPRLEVEAPDVVAVEEVREGVEALVPVIRRGGLRFSRDFTLWSRVLGELPDVPGLLARIARLSPAERQDPSLQGAMRRVDERLRGLDLPSLFGGPRTDLGAEGRDHDWVLFAPLEMQPPPETPERVRGYLAAALRASLRARELERRVRAALTGEELPPGEALELPEEIRSMALGGIFQGREVLKGTIFHPGKREAVGTWLRDLTEEVQRMLYLAAASLREEPSTADLVPSLLDGEGKSQLRLAWYSHLSYTPLEVLLPALPETPPAGLLAARVVYKGEDARQGSGTDPREWRSRFWNRIEGALEPGGDSPLARRTLFRAVALEARFLGLLKDSSGLRRAYQHHRSRTRDWGGGLLRVGYLKHICRAHAEVPGELSGETRAWMGYFLSLEGDGGIRDWPCLSADDRRETPPSGRPLELPGRPGS